MGFIFGMLLGTALTGSSGQAPQLSLAEIPFRCFAALDDGDDAYRACRRLSMTFQLGQQYNGAADSISGVSRKNFGETVDTALSLETRALRKMEAAAKQQPDSAGK